MVYEHHFLRVNGLRFHVVQAGPAYGPVVLLLHGFPEYWRAWEAQIEALTQAGYCVWAPDQRGYGETEKPAGIDAYGIETLTDDVCELIDEHIAGPVTLVGHDWGGAISWQIAMRGHAKLERLVILSSAHPGVMLEQMSKGRQRRRSWYMHFFRLPCIPEWALSRKDCRALVRALQREPGNAFSDTDLCHYREAWTRPGALRAMLNWYRALMRDRHKLKPDGPVTVPTLLIWGERDHALGVEMAQPSAARCQQATLVRLDAGHFLMREAASEVNGLLLAFLSGAAPPSAALPARAVGRRSPQAGTDVPGPGWGS